MRVFIAGGSGTIGIPLVKALVAAGHDVCASTRSASKRDQLLALGATVAVVDALDRDALVRAVVEAQPTHVVHQLTALPKDGLRRASELAPTNRLRVEGTRNLLEAAMAARARRFVVGSFAILSPRDNMVTDEPDEAAAAVRSMETQVLDATARGAVEGIILRYGLFYGPDAPSTLSMIEMVKRRRLPVVRHDEGMLPLIHLDDAVAATVKALDSAPAGAVYDIVDDHPASITEIVEMMARCAAAPPPLRVPNWLPRLVAPYMARIMSVRMPLSNARAKAELGWRPRYPSMKDGLSRMFDQAA